jgi:VRR-NUC domain
MNSAWSNFAARPPAPQRDLLGPRRDYNAEARVVAGVVDYVRWVAPEVLIFHVANGGLRSKPEAARLKWMGVLAGVPDLILVLPAGRTAFWEVKTPKGGPSEEQKAFIRRATELGHSCGIVRSIEDARRELAALGIETKEAPR